MRFQINRWLYYFTQVRNTTEADNETDQIFTEVKILSTGRSVSIYSQMWLYVIL